MKRRGNFRKIEIEWNAIGFDNVFGFNLMLFTGLDENLIFFCHTLELKFIKDLNSAIPSENILNYSR